MSEYIYKARTNKEIRGYARERLIGNMLIPCLVTFFFFSVKNVFGMLMQLGVLGQSAFAFVFYIALFLTINSIFGLIQYGISRYFLSFITTKKASPANIFAGFQKSTETIIGASEIRNNLNDLMFNIKHYKSGISAAFINLSFLFLCRYHPQPFNEPWTFLNRYPSCVLNRSLSCSDIFRHL